MYTQKWLYHVIPLNFESTLANYGNTVDRFIAFCSAEGVPVDLHVPADEFVLCAFAASSAGTQTGSTARNNVAALKTWHVAQNVEWRGGARLHYILAGLENLAPENLAPENLAPENLAPESSKRAPRPPINAAMLRVLYEGLDLSNSRDIAVFAAASSKFLPARKHILRSSRNGRSTTLRLPRTKTKRGGENIVLVAQSAPIDPRVALDTHLLANKCDSASSLFTYVTSTGPMSAGYPHTTSHSFRIGGTTELLLAGVSPDVVKAMGRWSSDAFHKYWRSLEDLAPIHAEFITT
ncbi:hypothetical protein C8R45DRAFT_1060302 [Mycena sanguinolenta]|nr:hypothetical protein C8R45DRAFT_1060302 [Mycena sanguinolenta]